MSGPVTSPRPERIAAAARALGAELAARVTVHADAFADALARELRLVAWDREQLVGHLQERLGHLRHQRFRDYGGSPVRVVERAAQPLEAVDLAWSQLRRGKLVRFDYEPRACTASVELMRAMGRLLADAVGHTVLHVSSAPCTDPQTGPSESAAEPHRWPCVGPLDPGPRVAAIGEDADRELAAYVLARASLRRAGTDLRAVKHAYVVGSHDRLQRHLNRLWVGARMGPPMDAHAFAGPVDAATRAAFGDACRAWAAHPDVGVWCAGGSLVRADDDGIYLAPALFFVQSPAPTLPTAGPMLVIASCTLDQAYAQIEAATAGDGRALALGFPRDAFRGTRSHAVTPIRGALLVERLPPGLPEPRPV